MILCISLSPCLETNIEVDSLAIGRVNKVIGRRTFFTGKAMNVATGLSRLGARAVASGFMFEDNGRTFEQEMHKEGVTYKFVWNRGRVKEVYKFIDRRSMLTEVVDEATPIESGNGDALLKLIADISANCKAVVLSGEVARGLDDGFLYEALSVVPEHVKKVIDVDGAVLPKLLECGIDLVKPNLEELTRATNLKISDKEIMCKACELLIGKGAKRVLLSLGKRGAVITDGSKRLYSSSLNVAMNSTEGAGDAMVAAATKALCEGASCEDILRHGVAAGTASVTMPDSISFSREKYEEILKNVTVKEI